LLEILKSRHIEINTKLSGRNIPKSQNVPVRLGLRRRDHAGVPGGFTWRVGEELEVVFLTKSGVLGGRP